MGPKEGAEMKAMKEKKAKIAVKGTAMKARKAVMAEVKSAPLGIRQGKACGDETDEGRICA